MSDSARLFKQPTAQERARGESMVIRPPVSAVETPVAAQWWTAIAWWVYLLAAVILALTAIVIMMMS